MNQDYNTVARYVPLKNWRPKLHTKGCPFKELDTQVEVKHEMFWIFLRFWIEISFFNIFWQKKIEKKTFKISFQYLENDPLNVLNLIVDWIYE